MNIDNKVIKYITSSFLIIGLLMLLNVLYWYEVRHEAFGAKWEHTGPYLIGGFAFLIMAWIGFLHTQK